jgi:hypothetical protein
MSECTASPLPEPPALAPPAIWEGSAGLGRRERRGAGRGWASSDVLAGPHGLDAESGGVVLHQDVVVAAGELKEIAFAGAVVGHGNVVGVGPGVVAPPPGTEPPAEHHGYWNNRRTVGVVVAGVGVVGLVLGGVFGSERSGETTDAANALAGAEKASAPSMPASQVCTNPPASANASCLALTNALNSNSSDAHLEESFFIGGAMLVAIGAVTTFWPGAPEPPASARLTPLAGPHLAGLSLSGQF